MISLLTPTRNRPSGVRRLIQSACDTADGPVEFVFYQDDDAPYATGTYDVPEDRPDIDVKVIIGPRIMLSQTWNECFKHAKYDVFMQCDDDVKFASEGWDTNILKAFEKYPDRIVNVYGRDGVHTPPACATQCFLHRRWVETVGHFVPGYYSSDMSDRHIYEVALMIGRAHYVPEVYTEHMHFSVGKSQYDATYAERLERHQRDDVHRIYHDHEQERLDEADKLRQAIANYQG